MDDGPTLTVPGRSTALRRMAEAGYWVGPIIAPSMLLGGWRAAYGQRSGDAASSLEGVRNLDSPSRR